jgi:hypothetical protein
MAAGAFFSFGIRIVFAGSGCGFNADGGEASECFEGTCIVIDSQDCQ